MRKQIEIRQLGKNILRHLRRDIHIHRDRHRDRHRDGVANARSEQKDRDKKRQRNWCACPS